MNGAQNNDCGSFTSQNLIFIYFFLFIHRRISTNLLLGVMFITWLCEIISFYFTTAHLSPILFLDIINALQGVFIFMVFVGLPRPFKLIKTYIKEAYNDRGSVDLAQAETEMPERQRFVRKNTDASTTVDNNQEMPKQNHVTRVEVAKEGSNNLSSDNKPDENKVDANLRSKSATANGQATVSNTISLMSVPSFTFSEENEISDEDNSKRNSKAS